MSHFFSSLSLSSGVEVTAAISLFFMIFYILNFKKLRMLWAFLGPILISTFIYYIPVICFESDMASYSSWSFVVIPIWATLGILASLAVILLLKFIVPQKST